MIEDEWIESAEELEQMLDKYVHLREKARGVFELRYERPVDPNKDRWELCARVLSRQDIMQVMMSPWSP